jgi:hypothetical protein
MFSPKKTSLHFNMFRLDDVDWTSGALQVLTMMMQCFISMGVSSIFWYLGGSGACPVGDVE